MTATHILDPRHCILISPIPIRGKIPAYSELTIVLSLGSFGLEIRDEQNEG